MRLHIIGNFKERSGDGYPPFAEMHQKLPEDQKRIVLEYLKRSEVIIPLPAYWKDVFTGESIPGWTTVKSDGKFQWFSDMEYYFEKYDLRLPDDLIQRALKAHA